MDRARAVARVLRESGYLREAEENFHGGGSYGDCWYEIFDKDGDESGDSDSSEIFKALGVPNAVAFKNILFADTLYAILTGTAANTLSVEVMDWILQTEMLEWQDGCRTSISEYLREHADHAVKGLEVADYPSGCA